MKVFYFYKSVNISGCIWSVPDAVLNLKCLLCHLQQWSDGSNLTVPSLLHVYRLFLTIISCHFLA